MTDVVIASAARTAIGSFGKSLRDVPPAELGAKAARAAIDRAGLEPGQVEQVVFGNVIHTAAEDMYMARVVGIKSGIPKEAPAFTVNRLCGSGVQAIVSAAQAIQTGDADVVLAGGAESMSRGVYWMQTARWGARMGDVSMVDSVVGCLADPFNEIHMGVTAENLSESHGISRDAQDEFALSPIAGLRQRLTRAGSTRRSCRSSSRRVWGRPSSGSMNISGATPRWGTSRSSSRPLRRTAR
jgi:acetyl-CoA C-acetyltransferase